MRRKGIKQCIWTHLDVSSRFEKNVIPAAASKSSTGTSHEVSGVCAASTTTRQVPVLGRVSPPDSNPSATTSDSFRASEFVRRRVMTDARQRHPHPSTQHASHAFVSCRILYTSCGVVSFPSLEHALLAGAYVGGHARVGHDEGTHGVLCAVAAGGLRQYHLEEVRGHCHHGRWEANHRMRQSPSAPAAGGR